MKFPVFKTRIKGPSKRFNLTDPKDRRAYFRLKAGPEIKKLRNYLKKNTFIAYLLGKKNSGKGTYSKMFAEQVFPERIEHFSIGDMIRGIDKELRDFKKRKELSSFFKKNYRGWHSIEELISLLRGRSTASLLPTELVLTLIKREIAEKEKKTLFIDGFPRDLDQISFALFFRDLIGYREDPDIFVLIDVPETVIDARMKYRVVCPKCQTSRNLKLLPTKRVGYDERSKNFYLICDNPSCQGAKMIEKEGDKLGIEAIRKRLKVDEKLMEKALSLQGVSKVLLRNCVPVKEASKYVDDYEITPEFNYRFNKKTKKVEVIEKPWKIVDDQGVLSYSLLPPPVVVSLIKQIVRVLNL